MSVTYKQVRDAIDAIRADIDWWFKYSQYSPNLIWVEPGSEFRGKPEYSDSDIVTVRIKLDETEVNMTSPAALLVNAEHRRTAIAAVIRSHFR